MLPFLAPIRSANHVSQQGTKYFVEITFLADSPYSTRAPSTTAEQQPVVIPVLKNLDDVETVSNKSRSSEGLNKLGQGSRPNSRTSLNTAIKKTSVSSLPTSARSEGKSSPVPVKDAIPAPTRQKNKGLEMSSGMMELFGGGGTSPAPSRRDNAGSAFTKVENQDAANDRRGRGDYLSQPGPEWFEGYDRLNMTGIELPDPNCPAEKVLKGEKATPDFDSDWQDAKEDVLLPTTSSMSRKFAESLPGPDIGAGVDDEEEEEEVVAEELQYESKVGGGEEEDKDDEDSGSSSSSKKGHPSSENNDRNSGGSEENSSSRRNSAENGETAGSGSAAAAAQSSDDSKEKKSGGVGGEMSILLVKNARIVNDDEIFEADILIEDGVIQQVSPKIEAPEGAEVIDASGKFVLPAGIDVYTQVSDSTVDDISTGCKSAIAGGTATIIEVVRPRGAESIVSAVKRVKNQLERSAACHVSLSVAITDFNGTTEHEMIELVKNEGVNSFVLDGISISDDKLFELFEHVKKLGALIRIVPENKSMISILEKKMLKLGVTGPEGYPQSRPESLEADKVNGICVLGSLASCPLSIVQVSSSESLGAIEKARGTGAQAHAEIATAAVAADGSAYFNQDIRVASAHLTDVPLRKGASERMIGALSTQPLVVCTSGHRPVNSSTRTAAKDFAIAQKGTSGAEERMAIVWEKAVRSGRIDPMRFVAVTSTNAAKMFNMYPKKGRIAVGADADLVIWDQEGKRVLESNRAQSSQETSLYDGITVHSAVTATIVSGKIAYQNGEVRQTAAGGFLRLQPNSPYLFSAFGKRDKFASAEKVEREAAPAPKAPQQNGQTHKNSGEFGRNRSKIMDSSIDFGGSNVTRTRNAPEPRKSFW
uniref:Amidohydro-rel domain-containing protein n=1 Tax=Caenorhabditis tropicalis TaxID=1561998 RepID=A0A1I7UXG8_9PELO